VLLFCYFEFGQMSVRVRDSLDRIEIMEDRIEYLEESLYEFYD
jgi:hypothetical protein